MESDGTVLEKLTTALSKYDKDYEIVNQANCEPEDYEQYALREIALSNSFSKVDAHDVYGFIFPENSFQVCDELDEHTGVGNGIRLDVVNQWYFDEYGKRHCKQKGIQTVVTEDLTALYVTPKKVNKNNLVLSNFNLNSYYGNRRLQKNIDKIFGLIVEVDNVISPEQIRAFIDLINSGSVPLPNFLINSGHGFHLYYVLDKPINMHARTYDVYPVITNVLNAIKDLVWIPEVSDTKPEKLDIEKAYSIIGTCNRKNKELVVTAYKVKEEKSSLEYIRNFIDKPSDDIDYDISFPKRSKYTKEEAAKLFPEWTVQRFPELFEEAERKELLEAIAVRESDKLERQYHNNRKKTICNPKLYQWFFKLISNPENLFHGNRYRCMVCLAIYGLKCGISKEQVRGDLQKLLPLFNKVEKKNKDSKFVITETDINNALYVYRDTEKTCHYTFNWIMEFCGIHYEPKTKRRKQPLSQAEHLCLAREKRDELYPDGSWRAHSDGETRRKILAFINDNPNASMNDCISSNICSRSSVYKYFDSCRTELGINIGRKTSAKEKIKKYREENPNASKAECIRDLALSKPTVYKYWQ